ncbi:permease, partial [Halorubrum sp. E3]
GSAATAVVDSDGIKIYFGGMLLIGAVAVGIGEIGSYIGSPALELLGLVLVIGAAVVVAFAILYTTVTSLRKTQRQGTAMAD